MILRNGGRRHALDGDAVDEASDPLTIERSVFALASAFRVG
jgi:hypothetical protein